MLSSDEAIVRCALFPRMVVSGVIAPEKTISDFGKEKDLQGQDVYTVSVGRESSLPSTNEKHDFGCRTAVKANEARAQIMGRPLDRPEETLHYRGCFKLDVAHVLSAPRNLFDLWVEAHPLAGLDEHCNIVLKRKSADGTKSQLSAERTGILAHLRLGLRDPSEHICDCDRDLIELLEPIKLVSTPLQAQISVN